MQINIFNSETTIVRSNEQRLKNIDKTMTAQRKKNRARRININVKVNAIAYLAEVMGGVAVFAVAFLPTITNTDNSNGYVYITIQVLYGNIIPACYLMNNSKFKSFAMDEGWIAAMSTVFSNSKGTKKTTREQKQDVSKENSSAKNQTKDENNVTIRMPFEKDNEKSLSNELEANSPIKLPNQVDYS